jgi:HSF-type DNA-binding
MTNSATVTYNYRGVRSLLERPENHHMIRWDAAGEHIIVERPEQLALHVLPSVYRQSRFASFSRQLNVRPPPASPSSTFPAA